MRVHRLPAPSSFRVAAPRGPRAVLVLVLAALLLLAHPAPPPPAAAQERAGQAVRELSTEDVDTWLDGLVPALLDAEQLPGATVAVVSGGEVVTLRGFGAADRPRSVPGATPVDPGHHLFRIGSASKLFTATAVLQQVERGALDLDGDVREHLDFPLELPLGTVTLRHLLSHTAGFEERVDHLITPDAGKVRDLRTELAEDPPQQLFAPGTTPAYSNYGLALAGYVVQQVTGVPFEEYVRREVLDPLGMTSSTAEQPLPPELSERMAGGFPAPGAEPGPFEHISVPPAGSVSSTARDMAAFLNLHLGHGPDGVLGPEALAAMHAPALPPASLGGLGAAEQMTLGFRGHEVRGERMLSHGGDTGLFHSELALFPGADAGLFVSLNGNGVRALSTAVLRQQLVEQFARRYVAPPERAAPALPPGAAERAAAVAGHYRGERRAASSAAALVGALAITTVTAGPDGTIRVASLGAPPTTMREAEPWLWREPGGTATLAARTDEDGVRDVALVAYRTEGRVSSWHGLFVPHLLLLAALLVLVVTLVAWPVNRLRRRRRWGPADTGARPRRVRRLAYAAPAAVLAGLVLFAASVQPDLSLVRPLTRLGQAVLLLGVLGVVPAAWHLASTVRRRAGVVAVAGAALLTLSLAWVAGWAVAFRVLWPDLSV
ncbi:serine hydrolase domain-containing protein [Kocuria rosea]|uniref:Class A beta-lactamase-related serine hydrolase n=1 Tax=Kocuria rosea TaxID=1275 RepID=A0A4R5Y8I7_KOCRO|nr:serine hydrolase domain-containing protein [Kocuria rosea]TDL41070.1 class A beta-lactamase-related serine hydrolase [Kocuria rosea]